jgi:hypothetical protein
MFCNKCGGEVPDNSKFCYLCRNELPRGVEAATVPPVPVQPVTTTVAPPPPPPPPPYPGSPPAAYPGISSGPFSREVWKKAGIVSLITLLVVGGLCILLIVILRSGRDTGQANTGAGTTTTGNSGGKALSMAQYADKVSSILQDSYDELVVIDFSNVDAGDLTEDNVKELKSLSPKLQARIANLQGDFDELESILPPAAAAALHREILDYYDESLYSIEGIRAAVDYLAVMGESSLKMEKVMTGVQAQFDSVQTYDQLIPLVDQSYNAWNTFLSELKVMKPPPYLQSFHQLQMKAAADLVDVYTRLRTAAVNQDAEAADAIALEADQIGKDYDSNLQGSLKEFALLEQDYGNMQEGFQELIDKVDALK